MTNFLNRIINWVWVSSSNPAEVSLTVKSGLGVLAGALIPALHLLNVNVGSDVANQIIDLADSVVSSLLMLVGAIGALTGFCRKVYLTAMGKNAIVTPPSA